MGLWNVKFDHKNGEQRVCKGCGASFHTPKPRWSCNACVNAKQKVIETNKRSSMKEKNHTHIKALNMITIQGFIL